MDPFIAKADETRIALKTAKEEVKKAQEEQDALTAEALRLIVRSLLN